MPHVLLQCRSLGTFIVWHREWTTSGAVSDRIVKSIPVGHVTIFNAYYKRTTTTHMCF